MTVADVADYVRLSRATIYEMARQVEIPCVKVVGGWRFKREQIDNWMLSRGSQPGTPMSGRQNENEADD
jgi:excisionase family DNA binding protein